MRLKINGHSKTIDFLVQSPTITDLFNVLNLDKQGRFVELNDEIYHPQSFESVSLQDNDVIEIIQFMAGG